MTKPSLPDDVGFLVHHFTAPGFAGAGVIILVSASIGMNQVHRTSVPAVLDIPRMVARDAFTILGGRTVGVLRGAEERGDTIPDNLATISSRIEQTLDATEDRLGIRRERSVWRIIANYGRRQALAGHWSIADISAMHAGVLATQACLEQIGAQMDANFQSLGYSTDKARLMSAIGLGLIAYGDLAPDQANFPPGRMTRAPTAAMDMGGALAFAADIQDHPSTRLVGDVLKEASSHLQQVTLQAMHGKPPGGPWTVGVHNVEHNRSNGMDKQAAHQ
jgi:hypothetical protein